MKYFLNTFRPIIATAKGRKAVKEYELPPFIDGSIRREPDLDSDRPSISALCRFKQFAPRLNVGDVVVYLTVKGSWEGERERHWRMPAALRVVERFESHQQAAEWYQGSGLPLPRNCMVQGNPPQPITHTLAPHLDLRKWDSAYVYRSRHCGIFLATEALCSNLWAPPIVREEDLISVFNRIPGTQTPPSITPEQAAWFLSLYNTSI